MLVAYKNIAEINILISTLYANNMQIYKEK